MKHHRIGGRIITVMTLGLGLAMALTGAQAAAAGQNYIANPGLETAVADQPAGWIHGSWGTNKAAFSYDTTGHSGRAVSVKVSGYRSGDAKWAPAAVSVAPNATYTFSNWYKSSIKSGLDAVVTTANGGTRYIGIASPAASAGWKRQSYVFTAPPDAKAVTFYHYLTANGSLSVDDYSLTDGGGSTAPPTPNPNPTPVPTPTPTPLPTPTPSGRFNRGIVSLNFDDGWRTIYTNGLPLLQKYGLTSTQYLNSEPVNGGYPDYMTYQMVKDFKAAGHELAWHTRSHADITKLSAGQLNTELTVPADFLTATGTTVADYKDFASPYGAYNGSSIAAVMKKFKSHRSTDDGYNTKANFDVSNVKIQNITNKTTPAQVKGWVDQAVNNGSWLVIVYHEVTGSAEDPTYAVSPANLEAELSAIKQSGVTVKTMDAALAELKPQL